MRRLTRLARATCLTGRSAPAPDPLDGARERVRTRRSTVARRGRRATRSARPVARRSTTPRGSSSVRWHTRAPAPRPMRTRSSTARRTAPGAAAPQMRGEILALRGRLWKDALHRAPPGARGRWHAARARDEYLAALCDRARPLPGRQRGDAVDAGSASGTRRRRWRPRSSATLAPARRPARGLGPARRRPKRRCCAGDVVLRARALRGGVGGGRPRRRARRQRAPPAAPARARCCPPRTTCCRSCAPPTSSAFTGHMLDAPGREAPRFPPALVPAVAAALRERVAAWHAPVVYTSAACGADLLFVEAAQAAGAEVNVVLPFARDEFVRTSVAGGRRGRGWNASSDALARAARVIFATEEALPRRRHPVPAARRNWSRGLPCCAPRSSRREPDAAGGARRRRGGWHRRHARRAWSAGSAASGPVQAIDLARRCARRRRSAGDASGSGGGTRDGPPESAAALSATAAAAGDAPAPLPACRRASRRARRGC
ncbi:MAG: hypothetical protein MZW92_67520 [Comamonadaceae bacterium]|nr:hypothetical protein [Comamonadaceae bacterium]